MSEQIQPETVAERRKRLNDQIARLTAERDALPSDRFHEAPEIAFTATKYLHLYEYTFNQTLIQEFVDWLAAHGYRAKGKS